MLADDPSIHARTTGIAYLASSGDGAWRSWDVDGGIPAMFGDAIGLIRSRTYGVCCLGVGCDIDTRLTDR
jgi:hypothetical protein